jgi:hypothetical protein
MNTKSSGSGGPPGNTTANWRPLGLSGLTWSGLGGMASFALAYCAAIAVTGTPVPTSTVPPP